nr:reverse transcriptase domain-containing protein [Tanacetum cinerariifolium]
MKQLVNLMVKKITEVLRQMEGDVRNVIVNNDRRGCTYKEFLACNPKEYNGKGGAIVYTCLIEKIDSVQDMSRLVPHLVTPENKRIEMYIYGLAPHIRRMVAAMEPTTIQKAVQKVGTLTYEAIRNGSVKKNTQKRCNGGEPKTYLSLSKYEIRVWMIEAVSSDGEMLSDVLLWLILIMMGSDECRFVLGVIERDGCVLCQCESDVCGRMVEVCRVFEKELEVRCLRIWIENLGYLVSSSQGWLVEDWDNYHFLRDTLQFSVSHTEDVVDNR